LPDVIGEPPEEGLIGLALAASAVVSSLAAPVLGRGDERSPNVFTRVVEQVVPTVVGSVDIDALLERIDLNSLLDRIDIDRLLTRIDVDALMARVDVKALLDRIDVGEIVERVDLDAVLAQVDMTALLDRIDVASLAERAEIGELVAQSSRDVAGSTLDLARRQLVAIDLLVLRLVQRVLHKRGAAMEPGPKALLGTVLAGADELPSEAELGQVTGRFAGAATRLAEFAIDVFMIITLFGIAANVVTFLVRTVLGIDETAQSMTFAGDIPVGARTRLMRSNHDRLVEGAAHAGAQACHGATDPVLAIAVSCVGRRMVLGQRVEEETAATLEALPRDSSQTGFYAYGEISPSGEAACNLHNQTMTLTTIREVAA